MQIPLRSLWAMVRPRRQPRLEPHRCIFDSGDGVLYAAAQLAVLRCHCGRLRLYGRW